MRSVYGEQEYYYGKCGELFLTIKGNIAFHCTLCENKYKDFQDYNEHILMKHYSPDLKEELTSDSINEEDKLFDPLSEDSYSIDAKDYIIRENEELETCETNVQMIKATDEDSREGNIEHLIELPAQIFTSDNKEVIRPKLRTINVKPTITDRKYKCPHCGFTGADKSNMRGHIRRHSITKPHKCSECTKTFHTRTELKTHLRSHTGERPFLCTLCGRAFSTSSKLCNHQKRHNNIRDKECSVCKMRFYDLDSLRGHMAVHSEKRDYKCSQCNASFKLPLGLRNHMKLHENKREYRCRFCDSGFNQHAGLYSHMKSCHTLVSNSSKATVKQEVHN